MRDTLRSSATGRPDLASGRTKTPLWTAVALLLIAAAQVVAFGDGGWQPGLILLGLLVAANFLRVYRRGDRGRDEHAAHD